MNPTSKFKPLCHSGYTTVRAQIEDYFEKNWPFESKEAFNKFKAADFTLLCSLFYPQALRSRLFPVTALFSVLFLTDDQLDHVSIAEGAAYYEPIYAIVKGEPDLNSPLDEDLARSDTVDASDRNDDNEELVKVLTGPTRLPPNLAKTLPALKMIMAHVWKLMRSESIVLASHLVDPCITFMKAQVSPNRHIEKSLGKYLEYRLGDIAQKLVSKAGLFAVGLVLTPFETSLAVPLELNFGRHMLVTNDIFSYDKEARAARLHHSEGAKLVNAVEVVSREVSLTVDGATRVLEKMCREWENEHTRLTDAALETLKARDGRGKKPKSLDLYALCLEWMISGNEEWSRRTSRYCSHDASAPSGSMTEGLEFAPESEKDRFR